MLPWTVSNGLPRTVSNSGGHMNKNGGPPRHMIAQPFTNGLPRAKACLHALLPCLMPSRVTPWRRSVRRARPPEPPGWEGHLTSWRRQPVPPFPPHQTGLKPTRGVSDAATSRGRNRLVSHLLDVIGSLDGDTILECDGPRCHGSHVLCRHGSLVLCRYGSLVLCRHGSKLSDLKSRVRTGRVRTGEP